MSLKLISTEKFGELDCNFYRNSNDEILLTREQIGTALEYSQPQQAITKIHSSHKNRLDKYSVCTKLVHPTGGTQDTFFYNHKGVMEICRWSRQSKADDFMDFTWEVMDRIIRGDTVNAKGSVHFAQQELFNQQLQSLIIQQKQLTALTTLITSTLPKLYKPPFTRWMDKTFKQVDALAEAKNLTRRQILHNLYIELQDTYDIDLNEYQEEYCFTHGLQNTGMYTLNTIGSSSQLKQMFQVMVDNYIEQGAQGTAEKNATVFTQAHAS